MTEHGRGRSGVWLAGVLLLAGPAFAEQAASLPEPADEEFLELLEFLGEPAGDDGGFEAFFDSLPVKPAEAPRVAGPRPEESTS